MILIAGASLALVACVCLAEPKVVVLTATSGTNVALQVTDSADIRGWIDSIDFDVITAGTTGDVTVAASPYLSTGASFTLASSNNLAADASFRPRFDGTDSGGAALTSDPPWRYMQVGTVVLSVTNFSATGTTFKAVIRYDRDR